MPRSIAERCVWAVVGLTLDVSLHILDRLIANTRGYWRRSRWWLLAICLAALADSVSTMRFMRLDGIEHELNPAFRYGAMWAGPAVAVALGKLAQLTAIVFVTLYDRRAARWVFFGATMMYAWAAWYNVYGRELYTPLLVKFLPVF